MLFRYTITLLQDRCVLKTINPDGSNAVLQEVSLQLGAAEIVGPGAAEIVAPVNYVRPPININRYYHGNANGGFTIKIYTVGAPQP
jgi:hypothetical protein